MNIAGKALSEYPIDEIKRWYLDEGVSVAELSQRLGITYSQTKNLLFALKIKKQGVSPAANKEWLEEQARVMTREEIAKLIGKSKSHIDYWMKKHKIHSPFKRNPNEKKIDPASPVFCYIVGLVATDGHLDKRATRVTINLNENDKELLEKIAEYFEVEPYLSYNRLTKSYTLSLTSKRLIDVISSFGVERFTNKTFEVGCPVTFASDDCLKMYLRGVIDGDGSIDKRRGYLDILSGSEKFIDGLIDLMVSMGVYPRKGYKKFKNNKDPDRMYPVLRLNKGAKDFIKEIYSGYPEFAVKRKLERAMNL